MCEECFNVSAELVEFCIIKELGKDGKQRVGKRGDVGFQGDGSRGQADEVGVEVRCKG